MRILFSAAVGLALVAAPAFAGGHYPKSHDPMSQPASNDMAVYAYPAKANYCPAGLQPVVVGGVICCGEPTHGVYHPQPVHKPRKKHKPQATYVSYGKGYGDTVVYEKGQ
ncbi:MAG: hypothetical protein QNJ16_04365 [Rhodobacter sp.]|nr:hypothetical protein [Rhodobacter sp.]